jgi:cysteinyl-tRNA synthetase
MSCQTLGDSFDIHGGGADLQFPHHENEIAQNLGACDCLPANYWMHANMMLLNGKKMSKSDGNNITPAELFETGSPFTSKVYSPMVFRFLLLQTHYRSTLNLTDEGLLAAEQGYSRIMKAFASLQKLSSSRQEAGAQDAEILDILQNTEDTMADDFNTAMALSHLFGLVNKINAFANNQLNINELSADVLAKMKATMQLFLFDIFGLQDETNNQNDNSQLVEQLMQLTIDLRQDVRARKDFATSDLIRDRLLSAGIQLKDSKTGVTWEHKKD